MTNGRWVTAVLFRVHKSHATEAGLRMAECRSCSPRHVGEVTNN